MKGLLIKDGRLMITQGKTLLGIAVFMIVCSFLQGEQLSSVCSQLQYYDDDYFYNQHGQL